MAETNPLVDLRAQLESTEQAYRDAEAELDAASAALDKLSKGKNKSRSAIRKAKLRLNRAQDSFDSLDELWAQGKKALVDFELAAQGTGPRSFVEYLGRDPHKQVRIFQRVSNEAHTYRFDTVFDGRRIHFVRDPWDLPEFKRKTVAVEGTDLVESEYYVYVSPEDANLMRKQVLDAQRRRNTMPADPLELLGI